MAGKRAPFNHGRVADRDVVCATSVPMRGALQWPMPPDLSRMRLFVATTLFAVQEPDTFQGSFS